MTEDKGMDEQEFAEETDEQQISTATASRARNRTVMLTPEMTGQVRALLHQDPSAHPGETPADPLEDFLPPLVDWDSPHSEPRFEAEEDGVFDAQPIDEEEASPFEEPPLAEPQGSFDPLTMVAPPVRHEPAATVPTRTQAAPPKAQPQPQPQPRQAVAARPSQPSFTVNARSAAPVSASAARTPSATPGRAPQVTANVGAGARPAAVPRTGKTPVVGFLVSFDADQNGEVFEIRTGRWLITSRPTDHGEYILINDETISPLHAIFRATKDGTLQVLDQLSEHGTGVLRVGEEEEIDVAGGLQNVAHGDVVRFGERRFMVCTIPSMPTVEVEEEEE